MNEGKARRERKVVALIKVEGVWVALAQSLLAVLLEKTSMMHSLWRIEENLAQREGVRHTERGWPELNRIDSKDTRM